MSNVNFKHSWDQYLSYPNVYIDQGLDMSHTYYRYMSIKAFDEILDGRFHIKNPATWWDPFEKIMVNGDYSRLKYCQPATYAACFTKLSRSEAHWKMYNDNNDTVRIGFDIGEVVHAFIDYTPDELSWKVFVGNVSYDLAERSIKALGNTKSKYHADAVPTPFADGDYADLLLLKRKAFKWEEELRVLVLVEGEQQESRSLILDAERRSKLIKSIQFNPKCSDADWQELEKKYRELWHSVTGDSYDIEITKSSLYEPEDPVVFYR